MEETEQPGETVGQRLRAAREAQQLTLDDVAAHTRIPVRHLASLEASEWESLPAPTYCLGFAKNYAAVVGLDRATVADDLRAEMGGTRQTFSQGEVFEPVDPKRTMPKWLILGAILGVVLVLAVLSWLRQRELAPVEPDAGATTTAAPPAGPPQPTALAAPAATGPVVITALQDAWIKVHEPGGATLRQSLLKQGETFAVPSSIAAPLLDTGRPEALRITVGGRDVPPIGTPGHSVSAVSLLPADLARGATAAPAPEAAAAAR